MERTVGRRAPLVVSAALAATLGLGLGGFAGGASASEAGTSGDSTLAGVIGALAQAGSDAVAGGDAAGTDAAAGTPTGEVAETPGATAAEPVQATGTETAGAAAGAEEQAAPAELSDDPFAMQFSIDGNVFQLPCTVADLERAGFALSEEDAGNVLDDGYSAVVSLYYGDPDDIVSMVCTVFNTSGGVLTLEECMVDSVAFSNYLLEEHDIKTVGGIALGVSGQADIEALYGPAEDPFVDGDYVSIDYEKDGDFTTSVEFSLNGDVLENLTIDSDAEYQEWPQGTATAGSSDEAEAGTAQAGQEGSGEDIVDEDATDEDGATGTGGADVANEDGAAQSGSGLGGILANLAGGTDATGGEATEDGAADEALELSDDPFSFQVDFDGTVIQLPCPVSDLEALGFALDPEEADDILEDGYQTGTSLFYGDRDDYIYVTVTVCNVSGSAQELRDCTVSSLSFHRSNFEGHTAVLPGGIEMGVTTVDEALAVLGEPSFDWTSDDGTARSFDFNPSADDFYRTISLWFRDGVLDEISLTTVAE